MLMRFCALLTGAAILAVKGWAYVKRAEQGLAGSSAVSILIDSNLFLVKLIVALLTSLGLLSIGCILILYALGPAALRAKAARLLGRMTSDSGLIVVLLILLLFAVLFR